MMCGMYMIYGVHEPEPTSSEGNTSSNPQVSALIPRPAFNGMEMMISGTHVCIIELLVHVSAIYGMDCLD